MFTGAFRQTHPPMERTHSYTPSTIDGVPVEIDGNILRGYPAINLQFQAKLPGMAVDVDEGQELSPLTFCLITTLHKLIEQTFLMIPVSWWFSSFPISFFWGHKKHWSRLMVASACWCTILSKNHVCATPVVHFKWYQLARFYLGSNFNNNCQQSFPQGLLNMVSSKFGHILPIWRSSFPFPRCTFRIQTTCRAARRPLVSAAASSWWCLSFFVGSSHSLDMKHPHHMVINMRTCRGFWRILWHDGNWTVHKP